MPQDSFSRCHPAANFLFFVAVIGLGVTIQHPAYAIAGLIGASVYYLLLKGKKGVSFIGSMAGMMVLITVLNPLINTSGKHTLFLLFGRPYTAEAMAYGAVLGLIFALTMVWFGCYSEVLTSDKFTALFGNLIPALSLLLVMVLRLIPAFTRKTKQISAARSAIGKGTENSASRKEQVKSGVSILSSLTDWAGGQHCHRRLHASPGLRLRPPDQFPHLSFFLAGWLPVRADRGAVCAGAVPGRYGYHLYA